ncbi:DICT sensory domain-containing protein [Halorubellus litoreus]|uniref:DICT sensory domain-containing protein n=1 Tax=Halorubellus litoreus TaxID=755308 RepID=A0ABD5VHT5_9EURY
MFDALIGRARTARSQFTVYVGADDRGDVDVAERFANHDVHVEYRTLPSGGPAPFVVVERDGEFAGAIALADLADLLEPPVVRPGDADDVSDGYRVLFEVLDDTVFTAMARRELLAVSREIEERAFRIGTGVLHAGFQSMSRYRAQFDVYRTLATDTDLDVHVYGADDWSPPEVPGIAYHDYPVVDGERYWVIAFLGGDEDSTANALLARQDGDAYDGFWTDDPDIASEVASALDPAAGR